MAHAKALLVAGLALAILAMAVARAIGCCSTVYVNNGYVRACANAYGTTPGNSYGTATGESSTYFYFCTHSERVDKGCRWATKPTSIAYNVGEVGSRLYAEAKYDSQNVWATAEATLSGSTWFCRV